MRNSIHTLTPKQLRWIDEYLVDGNATAAAIRAGYSERSARSIAHENMTKPDIQAVLTERRGVVAERLQITQEGVVQGLLEAVDLARAQSNPAAMVAGLREIGKMLGYYAPEVQRLEVAGDATGLEQRFQSMSDNELMALVGMAKAVH